MTAGNTKTYLGYLYELVDEWSKTYHRFINEKNIGATYSALTEETGVNPKLPKFKAVDRVMTTKYKNIFTKVYTENWSKEIFVIYCLLKANPWTYEIKDLKRESTKGSSYKK